MALTGGSSRVMRLALGAALVIGSLGLAARPVAAAQPAVTAPAAKVVFLDGITYTGTATLTTDVKRVEIVIDVEGSTRSIVADVPTTVSTGSAALSWVLKTPGGFLLPNTDVTARFRLTLTDGSNVVGPPTKVHYDDTRFKWKTVTGDFVTVHWVDGGQTFGLRAMKIGDDAIRSVSTLLGVTERDPIDFYVYGDRTAFYDILGAGTRENVGGEAHPDIRTLFANIGPDAVDDPWVGVVIPHELTHLVFDSASQNPYHAPLHWLNEGIAVYLSESFTPSDRSAVKAAVQAGNLMPLRALAAQFPTTQDRFFLAYSESVSAVSFLVDTYTRDAMVRLVRSYAGGVSDDEAFTAALGVDVAGFEAAWLASIGSSAPSPYGPQPAPAGPVPVDWGGSAPTPGPIDAGATPSPGSPDGDGSGLSAGSVAMSIIGALAIVALVAVWAWRRSKRAARPDDSAPHVDPAGPLDEPAPPPDLDPGPEPGEPDA
ncbi:MAG: peptidase MA family metallohydrolase [Chloroflexota bacterium]